MSERKTQPYVNGELVLVVDCSDLARTAAFWTAALGYEAFGPPVGTYLGLKPPNGAGCQLLLQKVTDPKQGKNRLHLDLRTRDLATEVARVRALGATLLTEEPLEEHGWRWHILGDPDGNEFCVLQPPASHWA